MKSKKNPVPVVDETFDFPIGSCVCVDGLYYFVSGEKKLVHLPTDLIVSTWNFPYIALATKEAVADYEQVGQTGFRDGTFFKSMDDGLVYHVSGRKARQVRNPGFLHKVGANKKHVLRANYTETHILPKGDPID